MPATERHVEFAPAPATPQSLSPTSASTWQQCELKYALGYLFGWREPSTMPQLIGNVVHRAVELLYALPPEERERDAALKMLSRALAEEMEGPSYAMLLRAGDPQPEVRAAGGDALDGLFEIEDPRRVTVGADGLEVWVSATLYGAPVRGRIDRIYDASGAEVVADYKTGRVPPPRYTQKAFFGLWTYAAALAASDPEHRLADRIELLYLIGRERLARPVLRDVALDHAKGLARIWRQVLDRVECGAVTARRSKLCDWCAFQPACPAFENVPRVGSAAHDDLLAARGLSRPGRDQVATDTERVELAAEQGEEQ